MFFVRNLKFFFCRYSKISSKVADRLIASFASMLFYWYHFTKSGTRINTVTGEGDTIAEHFLKLLNADKPNYQPPDLHVKCMDVSMISYAEHDFNASTFAARITTSTKSDLYSAITTAIGTLRGPLHGGANEKAMVEEFNVMQKVAQTI